MLLQCVSIILTITEDNGTKRDRYSTTSYPTDVILNFLGLPAWPGPLTWPSTMHVVSLSSACLFESTCCTVPNVNIVAI